MHDPPHSATIPSTPLNTAACMTLVPTAMSSVVCLPCLSIYVTCGIVLVVLVWPDDPEPYAISRSGSSIFGAVIRAGRRGAGRARGSCQATAPGGAHRDRD